MFTLLAEVISTLLCAVRERDAMAKCPGTQEVLNK